MKSSLSGFVGLFVLSLAFQLEAGANPNMFGSRDQRIPNIVFSASSFAPLYDLPQVDYTRGAGQWQARDFENFVRGLPANTKYIQVVTYFSTGAHGHSMSIDNNGNLAEKLAAAINTDEKMRAAKLFDLKPNGLPGYKLEPHLARFTPNYIPASGQKKVVQYQEDGKYYALLVESFNQADNTITLVNGKILNKGEYLLEVSEIGKAKAGEKVLYSGRSEHVVKHVPSVGTIHRVFQDGSIQLINQRRIFSHVDYQLSLKQNGALKAGVRIEYIAHPHHGHNTTSAVISVVFKNHVVLEDGETVIEIANIRQVDSCEFLMTTESSAGTQINLGK